MARSQPRAGPSQSQGRNSRRRPQLETDDEEEEQQPTETQEDGDEDGETMDLDDNDDSELSRKVNALVRLALFTEHKRAVLRREDINKKALGTNSRAFNAIFAAAQQKLRDTFGMELVELPTRAAMEKTTEDQGQEETATGMKKKATTLSSKTYIVRSCLDPIIVDFAAQSDAEIRALEKHDMDSLFLHQQETPNDEHDAERIPENHGSLISWTRGDQLGSLGILYVILSLVLVHGRALPEGDLRRYLKTLRLPSNPGHYSVLQNATSTQRSMHIDDYLQSLLRQSYLDRIQVGGEAGKRAKKSGVGTKRVRGQNEDGETGISYDWKWGPRAFSEVGEENIATFISEFMVGTEREDPDENEGATSARAKARQQELVKKMYSGVEKAAGGKLIEMK